MKGSIRLIGALCLLGVALTAAAAFAQSGDEDDAGRADRRKAQRMGRHGRFRGGPHLGRNVVHGEFKIQTQDGFATVTVDNGTVESVQGNTLTLKRADDQTVSVSPGEETKIVKDREEAELSDLAAGDLVHVVQRDDGDGTTVQLIMARTPKATDEASETSTGLAGILPGLAA